MGCLHLFHKDRVRTIVVPAVIIENENLLKDQKILWTKKMQSNGVVLRKLRKPCQRSSFSKSVLVMMIKVPMRMVMIQIRNRQMRKKRIKMSSLIVLY